MKPRFLLAFLVAFLCADYSFAQMEIVQIEPKMSKAIAGVVTDPSGAEREGVVVEERSSDRSSLDYH
jgi:hypothetical protein